MLNIHCFMGGGNFCADNAAVWTKNSADWLQNYPVLVNAELPLKYPKVMLSLLG